MIHVKEFENGIRLVVKKIPGLFSVTMGILVKTGACVESEKEDGISHFIEHMMFKGTPTRSAFAISDEMDRIGAQVNAFTGKDMTCYYAKATTGHTKEAFDILADLFLHSNFPDEEMVREKGVVIEEIKMNEDTPDDLCLDLLGKAFYGNTGYGRNILGTQQNVSGFTQVDMRSYMSKRYTTDNIVISMAGNIEAEVAEEMVERYFAGLPKSTAEERPVAVNLCCQSLLVKKQIEQVHIGMSFPSVKRNDRLSDATQIMNTVFGGGMSSRLFQTVREQMGLAYTVYSYVPMYETIGSLVVYAGVKAEEYKDAVDAIKNCIVDFKAKTLTKEEFLRGREQMLSSSIFAQESTSSQMLLYGKEMLYNNAVYNFEERVNKLSNVTLDDVYEAIDANFNMQQCAYALVGNLEQPL